MSGADAFPYPGDDPAAVRGLGRSLAGVAEAVGGAVERVRDGRPSIQARWASPAGGRALAEVDAVAGLGDDAETALADGQGPLDDYATALTTTRGTIDNLRASYDDAEADYTAALASIGNTPDLAQPVRQTLELDALEARNGRLSSLHAQYDEVMVTVKAAATTAGTALGEIAGRISPAPQSLNGDLVRANVLDRLPFMVPQGRTTTVVRTDDLILVDTGYGDDDVRIQRDPATGEVTVTVNGVVHRFTAEEAEDIVVRTSGGSDVIEVSPGVQLGFTLLGGEGNDLLAGSDGSDVIVAGTGDDHVVGGRGNDAMDGGQGSDSLHDGLSALTGTLLMLQYGGRRVAPRQGAGDDVIAGGTSNDRISGGDGNDLLTGGDGFDTIDGDAGSDRIDGGQDNDTLSGGDGDDRVSGGASDDTIDGGAGNDALDGGTGSDRIHGGDGDDRIDGGQGRDYLDGYRGNDHVTGGDGEDVIYAGEGDDTVDGGAGNDYVDGYRGNDRLDGGEGDDIVSGGAGDDMLTGAQGDDVIYAGAGRDAITDRGGDNVVYRQGDDTVDVGEHTQLVTVEIAEVPGTIRIDGSPEFQARVRADLETLASSPAGRQVLQQIGEEGDGFLWFDGDVLTIREEPRRLGGVTYSGEGNNPVIGYNPRYSHGSAEGTYPPIIVLQHELAHAYNDMSDTMIGRNTGAAWYVGPDAAEAPYAADTDGDGIGDQTLDLDANDDGILTADEVDRDDDGDVDQHDLDLNRDGRVDSEDGWLGNWERQAVGLGIDHDSNPATPDVPASDIVDHPDALTENALSDEMGLPRRNSYR